MARKTTVFITGANTGLGYEAVKALLKSSQAYEVVVGSRSPEKGEAAIAALKEELPKTYSSLSTVQVDLASDDSIEKAYKTVSSKFSNLDVLINNAGGGFDGDMRDGKMTTREGWNKGWDTNVAGTQVLTETFMPLLLKSSSPRLMFITSGTSSLAETERHDNPASARINASPPAGWPKEAGMNPIMSYRSAKTGLNMMVTQWARLLKEDGVKVWAISPGFLATGLQGVGVEALKKMGAQDPSVGGEFIKDVVEGKRDQDVGKVIRANMIQPW